MTYWSGKASNPHSIIYLLTKFYMSYSISFAYFRVEILPSPMLLVASHFLTSPAPPHICPRLELHQSTASAALLPRPPPPAPLHPSERCLPTPGAVCRFGRRPLSRHNVLPTHSHCVVRKRGPFISNSSRSRAGGVAVVGAGSPSNSPSLRLV